MFQQMTHAQWVQATAPKITGTWNLHQLLPSGLDFFIMLSSISSIMGNRGQANYAAANGFMDALAHHRVAQGENATSLNLGFFLSTGLVAQTSSLKDRYTSSMPFIPVTEVELHALLSIYCDPYASQANETSCQTIIGVTSPRDLYKRNPEATYWLEKPAFRQILTVDHAESTKEQTNDRNSSGQVGKSLLFVDSVDAAGATLTDLLISKLSKTLGVPKEDMHGQRPLHSYGVDSLVAVELRNWFFKEFDVDVAIFDMLGGTTITAVGNLAAGKIFAKREA
jgi:acyl carrier protein